VDKFIAFIINFNIKYMEQELELTFDRTEVNGLVNKCMLIEASVNVLIQKTEIS